MNEKTNIAIIGHCGVGRAETIKNLLNSSNFNVISIPDIQDLEKDLVDLDPKIADCINDNWMELLK